MAQSTSHAVIGNRGRPIRRDTVINRLQERGIHYRHPARCQAFTRHHRQERQRWALNNWQCQWRTVVFSDESKFNLHHADGRVRIYNERLANNCVCELYPYRGGRVMVWAAINSNFKFALVVCNGNLNARRYIDQILQRQQNNVPMLQWPARLQSNRTHVWRTWTQVLSTSSCSQQR